MSRIVALVLIEKIKCDATQKRKWVIDILINAEIHIQRLCSCTSMHNLSVISIPCFAAESDNLVQPILVVGLSFRSKV